MAEERDPPNEKANHHTTRRGGRERRVLLDYELYARIAEKLVFNRLTYDVQMEIARMHIAREIAFLGGKGFDVTADESIVSFLIQRGFHPRLGARPLRDAIESHLRGAIADAALAGEIRSRARLVVQGGRVVAAPGD